MKRCLALLLCLALCLGFAACTAEKEESTDPAVMAETYVGDGFTVNIKTLAAAFLSKKAAEESYCFDLATLSVTVTEKEENTCTFKGTVEKQQENGKTKTYSFKGTADYIDGSWQITKLK